jgi:hypothetical protein
MDHVAALADDAFSVGVDDADFYTTLFTWMLPMGTILAVPLSGFLIDFFGFFMGLFALNFLAILSLSMAFIPALYLQPIAFYSIVQV